MKDNEMNGIGRTGEMRNVYRISVGNLRGRGQVSGRMILNDIKVDLGEVEREDVNCIHLARDRTSGGLL
jgi:hypothetical protein